jgi:hypothetical protein
MSAPLTTIRRVARVLCWLTACLGAGLPAATATEGADVVATVGDTPILRADLDAVLARLDAGLGASAVPAVGVGQAAGADRSLVMATAVEQLVNEKLLRAEIEREGITVGGPEIDAQLGNLRAQIVERGGDWANFLERVGRDEAVLRDQIMLDIAISKLVRPKLHAQVLAAGFEKHRRELDGTRLRVSQILLRPDVALGDAAVDRQLERAAAIRREILQGTVSFADAATRHSAAPSRLRGGDVGWITRDGPLLDAFSRQVFALAKGDVSQPFLTPFGVHVVQVTDLAPGRLGIDVVRPRLEKLLATEVLQDLLTRLRAATRIDYAPGVPHFDPTTPPNVTAPRRVIVTGIAEPPGTSAGGS